VGGDEVGPTPSLPSGSQTVAPRGVSRELENVRSVPPYIDGRTAALRGNDVATARGAYEAYHAAWNGNEIYIQFRSRDTYNALEQDLQNRIAEGLETPHASLADLAPVSEALAKKYDEAILMVQAGASLHPLFDDLATLRTVRADLRIATAALADNDVVKARASFAAFRRNFPSAEPLIRARSTAASTEVDSAVDAAEVKFADPAITADDLKPLVANVTERYNFGVNLMNAAARKRGHDQTALQRRRRADTDGPQRGLIEVQRSLDAWEAGEFAGASEARLVPWARTS